MSVEEFMSTNRLRDMEPQWLNSAVQHISQSLPGLQCNIIKKGWDQLHLEPIAQEGFLESARVEQVVVVQERHQQQRILIFR